MQPKNANYSIKNYPISGSIHTPNGLLQTSQWMPNTFNTYKVSLKEKEFNLNKSLFTLYLKNNNTK
jgi:hypothetical protein